VPSKQYPLSRQGNIGIKHINIHQHKSDIPAHLGRVCGHIVEDVDEDQEKGNQQGHSTWKWILSIMFHIESPLMYFFLLFTVDTLDCFFLFSDLLCRQADKLDCKLFQDTKIHANMPD
jgi:hypothetical protein